MTSVPVATATTDRAGVPRQAGVPARPSGSARKSGRRRPWPVSVALHATLIMASVIAVGPLVWVLLSSFKPSTWVNSSDLSLVKEPTLANYEYVLTQTNFLRWTLNSVIVAAFTMALGVFVAATAGYALSRLKWRGADGLAVGVLLLQTMPLAATIQ